ncbi:tryptophan synthase subunit alpha [Methanococcoides methylutens]|uniref:Tryptophan synthase alpha chain n=1 Tax=Methanococcoides methylutens TaxID=2226 RepID=A0A099T3H2_METMT|nr:tryptophan synthase subunit alpha [Methanococcoides methylutens]KGK98748.1 tryptophan synthase subunit alpha [Methanococcoides methylutens]
MQLSTKFIELNAKKEAALLAYVCAGDPNIEATPAIVDSLIKGGADIIELGLPFSDPVADGPTIQEASERALAAGMNPDRYFELVASLDVDVPLVCMTYYNLIFQRGLDKFVKDCVNSGISGLIVPDLPAEESEELARSCSTNGVDLIFLIAPVTTDERIKMILEKSSGFVYIVSRLGVTGARSEVTDATAQILSRVKTDIPKAVGFGISNGEQASKVVAAGADGIIVGSAFVDIVASGDNVNKRLEELASDIKSGCKV